MINDQRIFKKIILIKMRFRMSCFIYIYLHCGHSRSPLIILIAAPSLKRLVSFWNRDQCDFAFLLSCALFFACTSCSLSSRPQLQYDFNLWPIFSSKSNAQLRQAPLSEFVQRGSQHAYGGGFNTNPRSDLNSEMHQREKKIKIK